jgi:small subunit ribosomal protein S8
MTVTDPIADMLTRIRNGLAVRKRYVTMPSSKLKLELVRVHLKYTEGKEPIISGLERVSKPGCRVYTNKENIPLVLSGIGIAILSTSRGVMTGKKAHRLGLGGELLCQVW